MRIAIALPRIAALAVVTSCLTAPAPLLAQAPSASSEGISVQSGRVKLIRDIRVPSEVEGVLREIHVDEGQEVEAGERLATISDEQTKLTVELKQAEEEEARLAATNDVNVRAAEKSAEYSAAEAKSFEELYEKRATPYWEMRRRQLDAERSELAIELAQNEQQRAGSTYSAKTAERKLAEHELARRGVPAPWAGQVAERYAEPGEWVQAGTPILRLVALDRLRVEANVDATRTPRQALLGATVTVSVHVTDERREQFRGRVGYVSPIMETATTEYRIWVDIENKTERGDWLVIPGMRADMLIQPNADVAERGSATR